MRIGLGYWVCVLGFRNLRGKLIWNFIEIVKYWRENEFN